MRKLYVTTKFKKDLRKIRKRGKDTEKLNEITEKLIANKPLDRRNRPHRLSGDWYSRWECHIEPDWLLIWKENEESVTACANRHTFGFI